MLHTDFIDFSFIIIYLFYCLHDNQYVMHQVSKYIATSTGIAKFENLKKNRLWRA